MPTNDAVTPSRDPGAPQQLDRSWVQVLAMLAIALVVFDSVATYTHLSYGYAIEQNALVAAMIDRWGADLALTLRALEVSALVVGLAWLAHRSRMARHGLVGITVVMLGVAVYHVLGPVLLVA